MTASDIYHGPPTRSEIIRALIRCCDYARGSTTDAMIVMSRIVGVVKDTLPIIGRLSDSSSEVYTFGQVITKWLPDVFDNLDQDDYFRIIYQGNTVGALLIDQLLNIESILIWVYNRALETKVYKSDNSIIVGAIFLRDKAAGLDSRVF